jgi:hypothetical protein
MKKIVVFTITTACSLFAHAEDGYGDTALFDRNTTLVITRALGVLLLTYLVGSIILNLVKMLLDYRLKHKLVDKGASEAIVSQLLQTNKKESRFNALKWAIILCSIGIGLLLVSQIQPFGIYSLIILTFCLAGAFLAYYFLLKKSEEE